MHGLRPSKEMILQTACAKHRQSMFTQFGAIISSNGRSKISVSEIMDHSTMPEYPATSANGIAHFIHSANPIDGDEMPALREACTREMSKVCTTYAKHMQYLCKYRSSSLSTRPAM